MSKMGSWGLLWYANAPPPTTNGAAVMAVFTARCNRLGFSPPSPPALDSAIFTAPATTFSSAAFGIYFGGHSLVTRAMRKADDGKSWSRWHAGAQIACSSE